MRFTVVWKPSAMDRLAELWTASNQRDEVADAADRIDAALAIRPLEVGVSLRSGRRFVLALPLGADYDVDEADRLVTVCAIWLAGESGVADSS